MLSLGQRIRELRIQKGITQMDLAKGICTPSMVSQIESDRARPSYKILYKLAGRLNVPINRLIEETELDMEYVSTFKMARAMVRGGDFEAAIPLLMHLLQTNRGQMQASEIQIELVECYLQTKQFDEMQIVSSDIQDVAMTNRDYHLLSVVKEKLGRMEFQRQRYMIAVFHWQKALDDLHRLAETDPYLEATVMSQLGQGLSLLGRDEEAVTYYQGASDMYRKVDNLQEMANTYMGLGVSYRQLNELEKASEYSERAVGIFEGLNNIYMTVKLKVSQALLFAQHGQEDEAIRMLEDAISKFQLIGKQEDVGCTYVELAKILTQIGELERAEETCQLAKCLLPETHLNQAWVNRILGQIALKRQQRDEALQRLHRSADAFKRMGEIGKWQETMYDISRVYESENDLLSAFHVLDDLRSYSHEVLRQRGIVL